MRYVMGLILEYTKLTVNPSDSPSHSPVPIVVFLVQESIPPQTQNMQPSSLGSHPRRAFARELLPYMNFKVRNLMNLLST